MFFGSIKEIKRLRNKYVIKYIDVFHIIKEINRLRREIIGYYIRGDVHTQFVT